MAGKTPKPKTSKVRVGGGSTIMKVRNPQMSVTKDRMKPKKAGGVK